MKIITEELDKLLEEEGKKIQYDMKHDTSSKLYAVAHLFYAFCRIDWYLIGYSMKNDKDYIFTLTNGDFLEYGDIYLPEMLETKMMGLPIERDLYFEPIDVKKLEKQIKEKNNG